MIHKLSGTLMIVIILKMNYATRIKNKQYPHYLTIDQTRTYDSNLFNKLHLLNSTILAQS